MDILNPEIKIKIQELVIRPALEDRYDPAANNIPGIQRALHENIPEAKRISYGRVYTIKVLSQYIYAQLIEDNVDAYAIASHIFKESEDFTSRGVALGMLSLYGLDNYQKVLPYFESAAASDSFDLRELAQMFFRKLIRKYPVQMKEFLMKKVRSNNPKIRRFVSETLRPVVENRWFYDDPGYPLSILRCLFKESSAYPRTSVGNNLSDLARCLPDLVYELVGELVESGDENSYRIAYRACRNLIKKEPIKVMDLLKVDEYKYKKRIYKRSDYQRS
jgi:3-methyladenine DNA glycosylase AlkC